MSSENHEAGTPRWLFDYARRRWPFNVDAAASSKNRKLDRFITREDDLFSFDAEALADMAQVSNPADVVAWLNPEYGTKIRRFVKHARGMARSHRQTWGCLITGRVHTVWFQTYAFCTDLGQPDNVGMDHAVALGKDDDGKERTAVEWRLWFGGFRVTLLFVRGGVQFEGEDWGAPFPSVLVVYETLA